MKVKITYFLMKIIENHRAKLKKKVSQNQKMNGSKSLMFGVRLQWILY